MAGIKGKYMNTNFQEISFGTARGIHIWGNEINFEKKFTPNPHNEDSKYYNKYQVKWYSEAAKEIIDFYNKNQNWPMEINVNNCKYALIDR